MVVLRTRRSQLAAMALGWLVLSALVTVGFTQGVSIIGLLMSGSVLAYIGWTYPVSCHVSPAGVLVRCAFRRRSIGWDQIVAIRRVKGPLRRQPIGDRRRLRPAPGAPLLVLESHRTVLLLGRVETAEENRLLVEIVELVSPALAHSFRLVSQAS